MAQIFTIIAGVIALQLMLCVAKDPRTISLQIVTIKGDQYLIADGSMFDPRNAQGDSNANANDNAAKAMAAFKEAESAKGGNLEGLRDTAAKELADAGNVVFVSGGASNYIQVPTELENKFTTGMLIRYVFATLENGEKYKPIEEGHVKIIIKKDGCKLLYKSLEFTSPSFGDLVCTLGPVHKGRFYAEPQKIQAYDDQQSSESKFANKKLSSFQEYLGILTPTFNGITFLDADQKVLENCVKGKISDLSVTFIVVNEEKQKLSESLVTWEFMVHSDKTLNEFGDLLRKDLVDSSGEKLKLDDLSVSYSFTFHYKNEW